MSKYVEVRGVKIGEGVPKICVPIVGKTKEEILAAAKSFEDVALDVVEWRVDWFEGVFDFTQVEDVLKDLDENGIIRITVAYGTDLKHLYPKFSLVTDAKLSPKIEGITDFSDLENPRQYTVISGSRRVSKTYTIFITVQQKKQ